MLVFFLGIIYYTSKGLDVMDSIIKAFMLGIGVALVMLIIPMALMFVVTLQRGHSEVTKASAGSESVQNGSFHEKKVEVHT